MKKAKKEVVKETAYKEEMMNNYCENFEPGYPGHLERFVQNMSFVKQTTRSGTTSEVEEAVDGAIRLATKMDTKIKRQAERIVELEEKYKFWHKEWELEIAHVKHAEEEVERLETENRFLKAELESKWRTAFKNLNSDPRPDATSKNSAIKEKK